MTAAAAPAGRGPRRPHRIAERLLEAFTPDQWRRGLGVHALLWGAGYLFGPDQWASSSSFAVIRLVPYGLHLAGGLAVAAGLVLVVGRRWACTAHSLGAVLFFVWAVGLLLALPYGTLAGWGGWLHALVVSAVHRQLSGAARRGPAPGG